MTVLLEYTCMISSPCILRWQCILRNVNDANSNYLGNQQQTDQKIVVIGLKTHSGSFLVPGELRGFLKEIRLITFFLLYGDSKSEENDFCSGQSSSYLCLGGSPKCFCKMLSLPSQPTKLPVGLTGILRPWHSSLSQGHMGECGSMAAHFQFSLALERLLQPPEWVWTPVGFRCALGASSGPGDY